MRASVLLVTLLAVGLSACISTRGRAPVLPIPVLGNLPQVACADLKVDYGYGEQPSLRQQMQNASLQRPPERWDASRIACDGTSRIGYIRTPEGVKLVVNVMPYARPGYCWLKDVKGWQGDRMVLGFGTAWLSGEDRFSQRGKVFACGSEPWEQSQPLG